MNANDKLARRARRVSAAVRSVQLSVALDRRRLECQQHVARYHALGLSLHDTPGLRQLLGAIRTLSDMVAVAELETAGA
jgi:hypothetical protein